MIDDEGVLFNPFSIGPANSGSRYTYEMPSSPTYPPPVYATWPPPKDHTNKSVSQGTLAKERSATGAVVFKTASSQMGQMAISKAINEDMAAAKQPADDEERIDAGGVSQAGSRASFEVKTLMSAKPPRSSSKSSISQLSTVSAKSMRSQRSTAKSLINQTADNIFSESTTTLKSVSQLRKSQKSSNLNKIQANRISQISLRHKAGDNKADNISRVSQKSYATAREPDTISRVSHANDSQADNISRVSMRSQANAHESDKISRVSMRSQANAHESDKISRVSMRSQANAHESDKISTVTMRSQGNAQESDAISRVSQKSQANDYHADAISRVSHASDYQADKASRHSMRSKTDDQNADNVSRVSVQSTVSRPPTSVGNASLKSKADMLKPLHNIGNSELPLRERADLVKKELSQSMETSKSLSLKAAELSQRLRAGNENKHNRYHSVVRMSSNIEPLKRCRDDRMSLWFKDSVLS